MEVNKKKIKIVHFVGGKKNSGAFKGANILHEDLIKKNIVSSMIYEKDDTKIKKIKLHLRQSTEKFPKIFYPKREKTTFSSSIIGYNFLNDKLYKNSDIVHLHWINNGFFDISKINLIHKPIVWTIRDMWPFTGGCHYTLGCNNFTSKCGYCPQLSSHHKYDLSTFIQNLKMKYYNKNIKFIVNSNWMKKMASKSSILKNFEILTFFPSFDFENFFEDYDDNFIKSHKINKKKKIILYGAQNIEAKYKVFKYFLDCLDFLEKEKYQILFFGNLWDEKEIKKKNIEYINMGFIKEKKIQRKLYSLADIFVATSLQEGFPKTVVEALLCRTPVAYFKETAIEDVCESGLVGGYGANYCDSKDLAYGIKWLTNNSTNKNDMLSKAIKKITSEFNSEKLVQKYVNLYEKLI